MNNRVGNKSYWYVRYDKDLPRTVECKFSERFANDKLFYEDDHKILILDGVLLNKYELFKQYKINSLECLLSLVLEDILIAQYFTGPFTIFLYDKDIECGYALGNQTGDASVFYEVSDNRLISISNNFTYLSDHSNIREVDECSAHYLLTYGFIVGNGTIVKDIKRLRAGEYLMISNSKYEVKRYHRFDFSVKQNIDIEDASEKLDYLFRQAVRRCFEKDIEYGYHRHLADISAGLDSRMTNWVAKDLGYNNITNISYSQFDSDETRLVKKIVKALGNQFYFLPLDDVSFLYDIDEIVEEEFGTAYYCGITGGWNFLNFIDFNNFGLEHTGQIGDAVVSTFINNPSSKEIDYNIKRNSYLLKQRFNDIIDFSDYKTQEEFVFYTRLTQGALSTHYIRSNYTYAVSPFMDIDLLTFCASLPDDLRKNHRLYWHWIDKKYPIAGRIPSSRVRDVNIFDKCTFFIKRCYSKSKRISLPFLYKIGLSKSLTTRNNMNPHTYWIETNSGLRNFIDNQYSSNKHLISDFPLLCTETEKMIQSSRGLDNLMAISMLATVKRFCDIKK